MSLIDRIKKDTFIALKEKDQDKAGILQIVSAELKNEEIEKGDLSEEQQVAVVRSQVKKLNDSIEQFKKGGRRDLADRDMRQKEILEKYLPSLMSTDEIKSIVSEVISETGAKSMSDMGKVMGAVMPQLKGKADGSDVKAVVEESLR